MCFGDRHNYWVGTEVESGNMAGLILLLAVVLASYVGVRAGAVALELTGMSPEKARFQALSAFTNTGFTTTDAEDVVSVPIRRKIISFLIILGHAGTVSVMATLATSLLQRDFYHFSLNVLILAAALFGFYRLAQSQGITSRMSRLLRRWIRRRYHIEVPAVDELLNIAEGFGVVRVTLDAQSPFLGKPLRELDLKARKIQILSISRSGEVTAVPKGDSILEPGDQVICYGSVSAIEESLRSVSTETRPGS